MVLKAFNVIINPPKSPMIKEVIWMPHLHFLTKCNTDGVSLGCPGQATCAGVFRNSQTFIMGCFTLNIGQANAFQAELIGIMHVIELVHQHGWWNLWLETDSLMATLVYKDPSLIPWEGSSLADKLASMAYASTGFTWFTSIPIP
ncbi:hypothetical protein TSUD_164210 [Trifolium subterraneum]|uniref:RNase H type-1 domain-containing protein n=1 Tax=Trifolium subterraneum TaxID=3900 RepID=A0A2Z6MQN8_TRISU|nr:hypothetical protein TSUD_164210 [Trifolium subterraneum]